MPRLPLAFLLTALVAPSALAQVTVTFPHLESLLENPDFGANDIDVVFEVDASGNVNYTVRVDPPNSGEPVITDDQTALVESWQGSGTIADPDAWDSTFQISFQSGDGELGYGSDGGVGYFGIEGALNPEDNDPTRIDNADPADQESLILNTFDLNASSVVNLQSFSYANTSGDNARLIFYSMDEPDAYEEVSIVYDLSDAQSGTIDVRAESYVADEFWFDAAPEEADDLTAGASFAGFTIDVYPRELNYDLNGDESLDELDIQVLIDGWRATTPAGASLTEMALAGDVNRNGVTDYTDWYLLRVGFAEAGAAFTLTAVPEPSAALLTLMTMAAVAGRRRMR